LCSLRQRLITPEKEFMYVERDVVGTKRTRFGRNGKSQYRRPGGLRGSPYGQLVPCPALHVEGGKVRWRDENALQVRRRGCLWHVAESVQDAGGRDVQLLVHDERHSLLPVQSGLRHLQVRKHQGRRLHHLHQRRQDLLRDDSSLLRLPRLDVQSWLLLVRLLGEHASLLLLLIRPTEFVD